MKTIQITIDELGNPSIDAKGFVGGECKKATKPIEDIFAGGSANTVEKPEMKQGNMMVGSQQQGQQMFVKRG